MAVRLDPPRGACVVKPVDRLLLFLMLASLIAFGVLLGYVIWGGAS